MISGRSCTCYRSGSAVPIFIPKIGKYFSRRCLVYKFPYGVIYQYQEDKNEILIVAIAHLHRKPDYWYSRDS